ncbi:MAG: 6-bladed beta-propeller [Bacteroidales bacterium]|nr:6-bladed beta-propeller [Bacteroidales bacterium]
MENRYLKFIIVSIIATINLTSCNQQKNPPNALVYQAVFTNQIKLSDYFSSLDYVFLEDHPDGGFIAADKIIYFKQRWYLLDKSLMAILCYDNDGKFKFKIQSVGKGPGEYQLLSSIFIVPENNELWAHCRMPGKHLVYSLDGKFLREEKCARGAHDLEYLGKDKILEFSMYEYVQNRDSLPPGLFFSTRDISDSKQLLSTQSGTQYYTTEARSNFSLYHDTVFFISQSDSLFTIDSRGHVNVSGVFDFGDYHPSNAEKNLPLNSSNPEKLFNSGKVIWKDLPVATKNLFFFQFGLNSSIWYGFIDRSNHALYCTQGVLNDINSLPFVFPTGKKSEDEVVGLLSADYMYAFQESISQVPEDQKQKKEYKQLSDFISRALAGSGHVLIIAKLKQ